MPDSQLHEEVAHTGALDGMVMRIVTRPECGDWIRAGGREWSYAEAQGSNLDPDLQASLTGVLRHHGPLWNRHIAVTTAIR